MKHCFTKPPTCQLPCFYVALPPRCASDRYRSVVLGPSYWRARRTGQQRVVVASPSPPPDRIPGSTFFFGLHCLVCTLGTCLLHNWVRRPRQCAHKPPLEAPGSRLSRLPPFAAPIALVRHPWSTWAGGGCVGPPRSTHRHTASPRGGSIYIPQVWHGIVVLRQTLCREPACRVLQTYIHPGKVIPSLGKPPPPPSLREHRIQVQSKLIRPLSVARVIASWCTLVFPYWSAHATSAQFRAGLALWPASTGPSVLATSNKSVVK